MKQVVLTTNGEYAEFDRSVCSDDGWIVEGSKPVLLVCDKSFPFLPIRKYFEELEGRTGTRLVKFDDFEPNPLYESVVKGVQVFHENACRSIIAVGGGSAIDVAKCIKLYANMNPTENYLSQEILPNSIKLAAVPTTAGTGSEATRYAVIYFQGEKQSIADPGCVPSLVLLDASALKTLPEYQKKSTMLDALCHGIESFWSVNSTEESKAYSREAIQTILANKDGFLSNEAAANAKMLRGAYLAGKAINITQTTAGHAMSYKLTSLYGIAHGHAAALCVSQIWPYMLSHKDRCVDPRGEEYLDFVFEEIALAMGCKESREAVMRFDKLLQDFKWNMPIPKNEDFEILRKSVNLVRLRNHPVELDVETIDSLYHQIWDRRKVLK